MKAILLDYLSRRAWVLGSLWMLHVLLTVVYCVTNQAFFPAVALFGGSLLLSFDIMQGGSGLPRTLLSLPVTEKQIGRAWRIAALELPALLYLGAQITGTLVALAMGIGNVTWQSFLILLLVQTLILGTHFFALTGLPSHQASWNASLTSFSRALATALWAGIIPFSFLIVSAIPKRFADIEPAALAVGSVMLALTIAGWFRATGMVRGRLSRSNRVGSATQPSLIGQTDHSAYTRFGGLPYFAFFSASRFGSLLIAILSLNWGAALMFGKLYGGDVDIVSFLVPQVSFFAMFLGAMTSFRTLSQFRLLQSLPLGTRTLTHLLILLPIPLAGGFALLAWLILRVLSDTSPNPAHLVLALACGAPLLLIMPMILRYSLKPAVFLFAIFCASGFVGMTPTLMRNVTPTLTEAIGLLSISIAVFTSFAWMLTQRTLRTSHPWKSGALRMPFQPRET